MSGGPLFIEHVARKIVEFMNEDELTVCKKRLAAWEETVPEYNKSIRKLQCFFCKHFFPTHNGDDFVVYPHECYTDNEGTCISWCGYCNLNTMQYCEGCKCAVCPTHLKLCKRCKKPMCLICQNDYGKRHSDCDNLKY